MKGINQVNNVEKGGMDSRFVKLSSFFFVLTGASFLYFFSLIPSKIGLEDSGFPVLPKWIIIVCEVSCLSGVVFGFISIIKKEKPVWLKILVASLNTLLFVFVAGMVVLTFHNR